MRGWSCLGKFLLNLHGKRTQMYWLLWNDQSFFDDNTSEMLVIIKEHEWLANAHYFLHYFNLFHYIGQFNLPVNYFLYSLAWCFGLWILISWHVDFTVITHNLNWWKRRSEWDQSSYEAKVFSLILTGHICIFIGRIHRSAIIWHFAALTLSEYRKWEKSSCNSNRSHY